MGDRGHRGSNGNGSGHRRGPPKNQGGGDNYRRDSPEDYQPDLPETLISFGDVIRITPRPNQGTKGTPIQLEANHFRVDLKGQIVVQQYDVTLVRVDSTGKIRKANQEESHKLFWNTVRKNQQIFGNPEQIVYDRKKQMFTLKELEECKNKKPLTLRDKSILLRDNGTDMAYTVEIKHVGAIDVNNVKQMYSETLTERERQHVQFLDLLFRQGRHFNDQLVPAGRSFYFRSTDRDYLDLGCGRELLRGFYLSTRIIDNWQLSLNVNWNATAFYEQQNLIEFAAKFLCAQYKQNYHPSDPKPNCLSEQDREFLEKELKNVQLKAVHIDQAFKPTAVARVTARTSRFEWKEKDVNHGMTTVEEYFAKRYNMKLKYPEWPLIQRGKGQNIRHMPMEVCEIVAGQRVKNKDLTENQHQLMIRQTAVPPAQRRDNILNMLKAAQFATDARLRQFYISMSMSMAQVSGRVLQAPVLQYTGSTVTPHAGQWNGARLFKGARLENWGFLNIGARSTDDDIRNFADQLYREGKNMGMDIERPYLDDIYSVRPRHGEEKEQVRNMLRRIKEDFERAGSPLQMLVIVLEKKQRDGPYNEIKRFSEQTLGIMTQCLQNDRVYHVSSRAPDGGRKGRQALSNIILKINAKMGGVNVQIAKADPVATKFLFTPILFVGADVTHPEPGDKRSPSIAAICGNIDNHPNRYIGIEQVQSNRAEVIVNLKQAIKELLKAYYSKTRGLKPDRIIFYRDGVSEGQFLEVLQKEVHAIETACLEIEPTYKPAITFIVVQKRHHTRFFKKQINPHDKATVQNIPPGTVVDSGVTHPVEFDFFLCSHQGIQGTSKPTHYHVLFDQTGFTADELQALTYQLCHTYARCTRSVSVPAPCYYAHHIAFRAKIRSKGLVPAASSSGSSSTGSDSDRLTEEELRDIQQLISLNVEIKDKMYWQ